MKRTLIPVLLGLVLVMQFVQAWIISRLPAEQLRLQAEVLQAARQAAEKRESERLDAQIRADEQAREEVLTRREGESETDFAVRRALRMARGY
jgi:hypothetical protein